MFRLPILVAALALAGCGGKFSSANKFAMDRNMGGVVEIAQWPALPAGVAGYNLYLGETQNGKFEKINDFPITGGKMLIPHLEPGRDYWFKLSAVGKNGAESRPGQAFKRKAALPKAP